MACSPKGCNCTFNSSSLSISVDGGVVTIEQAEITDLTELQDDVLDLQAQITALAAAQAAEFDAIDDRFTAMAALNGSWSISSGSTSGGTALVFGAGTTGPLPAGLMVVTAYFTTIQTIADDRFIYGLRRDGVGLGQIYSTGPTASVSLTRYFAQAAGDYTLDVSIQRIVGSGTASVAAQSRLEWMLLPTP